MGCNHSIGLIGLIGPSKDMDGLGLLRQDIDEIVLNELLYLVNCTKGMPDGMQNEPLTRREA